jgi:GGDEF domain-containing protein
MSTDNSVLDMLTGLINRKGFEEKLKAAVLQAQQNDHPSHWRSSILIFSNG